MPKLVLTLLCLILVSCGGNPTKSVTGFSDYLADHGYSFYNPPRTGRGPNTVFIIEISQSGKKTVSPMCEKMFEGIKIVSDDMTLPAESQEQTLGINFAAELSNISLPIEAGAGASKNFNVTAEFGGVRESYFNRSELFNQSGSARGIKPDCFALLRSLSDEALNNTFIIQKALSVDSVSYKLVEEAGVGASAYAKYKETISADVEAKVKFKSSSEIEISETRNIAFIGYRIKSFSPTGTFSGNNAKIEIDPDAVVLDMPSMLE